MVFGGLSGLNSMNLTYDSKFQVQVSSFKFSSLLKLIYYKFMTSILQNLEYETYDVPLLAVSYSYSRRAVV